MPLVVYLFLLIQLLAVAYVDIKYKKILNLWSLMNVMFFVLLLFFYPGLYLLEFKTFFYSFVFLLVGFILYLLKVMGGGDSKYLASSYLLIPGHKQEEALTILLIFTALIGFGFLIFNTYKNREVIKKALLAKDTKVISEVFGSKIPFAPIITLSWVFFGIRIKIWAQ